MITKQIAGLLYSFSYKLQDNEGDVWDINSALDTGFGLVRVGKTGGYIRIYASFWQIGSTYKILAREMDLTKPIEGVGIPAKELTKLYYEVSDSSIRVDDVRSNYVQMLVNGQGFSNQVHRINLHFDTMRGCQINWLYTHKFNLDFPEGSTTNLI